MRRWFVSLFLLATNSHTTVQAVWVLYLLKYRFPTWIDETFK